MAAPTTGRPRARTVLGVLPYPTDVVRRKPKVTVLGGGHRGTALASLLAGTHRTTLWTLDAGVTATASLAASLEDADIIVVAGRSDAVRGVLEQAAPHIRPWAPILSATKGLEGGTHLRMTEVAGEVLPGHPVGVLAGHVAVREELEGRSAAAVIAFADPRIAESVREALCTPTFVVYASQDVVGCEIAGAVTSAITIAAGICTGLRTDENTRAAVITEGLAELIRLGLALGADARTFVGSAGMGDVIATCACSDTVERRVGEQLATGRDIDDIVDELGDVAEGVNAVASVIEIARAHGVMMPIAAKVDAIINRGSSAALAFRRLRPVSAVPESNGAWVALRSPRW